MFVPSLSWQIIGCMGPFLSMLTTKQCCWVFFLLQTVQALKPMGMNGSVYTAHSLIHGARKTLSRFSRFYNRWACHEPVLIDKNIVCPELVLANHRVSRMKLTAACDVSAGLFERGATVDDGQTALDLMTQVRNLKTCGFHCTTSSHFQEAAVTCQDRLRTKMRRIEMKGGFVSLA